MTGKSLPRRWFSGPKLLQWKGMVATGQYQNGFACFPYLDEPKPVGSVVEFIERRVEEALRMLEDFHMNVHPCSIIRNPEPVTQATLTGLREDLDASHCAPAYGEFPSYGCLSRKKE